MVISQTTSITPSTHADTHRTGGTDPLTGAVGIDVIPHGATHEGGGSDSIIGIYAINSDILKANNSVKTGTNAAYTLLKAMTLTNTPAATLSIAFDLSSDHGSTTVYGRIYRNGVAVGTEQSAVNLGAGVYQEKLESIGGWSDGDELQIYVRYGTGSHVKVKNLEIRGEIPVGFDISNNDP